MEEQIFNIENVRVVNLFGHKDVDWHLLPQVNILGGINGSGKSTVMLALYQILTAEFLDDTLANLMDRVEITLRSGHRLRWEKEKATLQSYLPDPRFRYRVDTTKIDERGLFNVQKAQLVDGTGRLMDFAEVKSNLCIDMLSTFEQMKLRQDISDMIGQPGIRTSLDLMLYKEINRRNELLVSSIRFLSVVNRRKEINKLQKELDGLVSCDPVDQACNARIRQLEEKIARKLDFVASNLVDIHDVLDTFFASTGKKSVRDSGTFLFSSGGDRINYLQLSIGEKQLLLVLLKTFNTEMRGGILLLDEADLGMHIEWKEKLIATLRKINPNLQIITSTHAPSLIRGWFDNVQEMSEIATPVKNG